MMIPFLSSPVKVIRLTDRVIENLFGALSGGHGQAPRLTVPCLTAEPCLRQSFCKALAAQKTLNWLHDYVGVKYAVGMKLVWPMLQRAHLTIGEKKPAVHS